MGIWREAVPVTGLAENFSPIPRIAPPPLGSEGTGTLGPDAAFETDRDPASFPVLAGADFDASAAASEEAGMFLGSLPERRSAITLPHTGRSGVFAR
jgi:hypothetical protein